MARIEPLFEVLTRRNVCYVVVGGVAVVLHGHPRLTADVDLAHLRAIENDLGS